MKNVLFINACVRPESRTLILAKHYLDKLAAASEISVTEVVLDKEAIQPLNSERLALRDKLSKENDFSDAIFKYAKQFKDADHIVIAAPYWDLSFPAMLKDYLELATACGVTFYYTPEGRPAGLCKAEKIAYITTSGGPCSYANLGYEYVKALGEKLYGISDVQCYKAEMLDVYGTDVDAVLESAKSEIDKAF